MKNLKVIQKFWLLSAALVGMLTLQIGAVLYNNEVVHDSIDHIAERDIPVLDKAHQLKLAVIQVQQWLTDISATRGLDGLNDGFDEAENNAQLFKQLIDGLQTVDPDNTQQYQAMLPVFDNYYETGKRMAQAYVDQGPIGGNKMMADFDEAAAALAEQVDTFVAKAQANSTTRTQKTQDSITDSSKIAILLSAILIIVVAFVFMLLIGIMKSIPAINQALEKITQGELNHDDINLKRNDEIGDLANNITMMKQSLRSIMQKISSATTELHQTASSYTNHMNEMLGCMSTQKGELDQVATAMTEMSSSAVEMANHAKNSSEATRNATQQVIEGNSIVIDSSNTINRVADEIKEAAAAISELSDQSQQIGTILDVIRDIAEQTNLLALNAAIEAARAGDQGRGFAVVADEVRTLAQRTQKSTEQIQEMIEKLQNTAQNASKMIQHDEEESHASVDKIKQASDKIESVKDSIQQIDGMSAEIASAALQQSSVAEEMTRNISNIYTACEHNTDDTQKLSVASQQLDQLANNLSGMVQKFKI